MKLIENVTKFEKRLMINTWTKCWIRWEHRLNGSDTKVMKKFTWTTLEHQDLIFPVYRYSMRNGFASMSKDSKADNIIPSTEEPRNENWPYWICGRITYSPFGRAVFDSFGRGKQIRHRTLVHQVLKKPNQNQSNSSNLFFSSSLTFWGANRKCCWRTSIRKPYKRYDAVKMNCFGILSLHKKCSNQ